jgi:hypothetical protein
MKNLLFNNRFVYQQTAPSQQPKVETVEMEPEEVKADKPASLEELNATLQDAKKELYAHFRMMEEMAKTNPAMAKALEGMEKTNKYYQEYLEDKKQKMEKMENEGILPHITPPTEKV